MASTSNQLAAVASINHFNLDLLVRCGHQWIDQRDKQCRKAAEQVLVGHSLSTPANELIERFCHSIGSFSVGRNRPDNSVSAREMKYLMGGRYWMLNMLLTTLER